MQLNKLSLTNFRVFEQAELEFQPGMNLIVGINGVGKSTVLSALRTLLSHALPQFTVSQSRSRSLTKYDITVGKTSLSANLQFMAHDVPFRCEMTLGQTRKPSVSFKPGGKSVLDPLKEYPHQPLAVYFSTRRSVPNADEPRVNAQSKGRVAAYSYALFTRELRLREFTDWWMAQKALADENDRRAKKRLRILEETTHQFLNAYSHLQVIGAKAPALKLQKGNRVLDVQRQLSDGERGLLALALDLTRRLILANPDLSDPTKEGQAVVLIDELDLHLHPRWQRTVSRKLTQTFQQCQFIATTHSPQVIGEAKSSRLIVLEREGQRIVVKQDGPNGYGLDSSWILRHLMGTESRALPVQKKINEIEDAMETGDLALARRKLAKLRETLSSDDDEVVRLEASINNLEALADEVDSETN